MASFCPLGSDAFRDGRYADAFREFSCSIVGMIPSDIPLIDYGLASNATARVSALVAQAAIDQHATDMLVTLLLNRAAASLKLGRRCRALADTEAACCLAPNRPKVAFRRAQALLSIGACTAARAVLLAPCFADDPELQRLAQQASARRDHVEQRIAEAEDAAEDASAEADAVLPMSLAYLGPLELRHLPGKGRALVATADVASGALLIVEPSTFPLAHEPETADHPLPLFEAIANELGTGSQSFSRADAMREFLACLHPTSAAAEGETQRDVVAGPRADAIARSSGLPAADNARLIERRVQRNMMSLTYRANGDLVDHGAGLFPFTSLLNHSCHANACFHPISRGHAIVARATRDIAAGEEVCDSYAWLSTMGAERRSELQRSHGFDCRCERCTAPRGSPLFELERRGLSLTCPACSSTRGDGGGGADGGGGGGGGDDAGEHALLPDDPYAARPAYRCAAAGCAGQLSADEAWQRVRRVCESFDQLNTMLEHVGKHGDDGNACRAVAAAEQAASRVLTPSHHKWMAWARAAMGIASEAEDDRLLLRAYVRKEGLLLPPLRGSDDDVFVRFNHALVAGLETAQAVVLLRSAYSIDSQTFGSSIEAFIRRWVPSDFDDAVSDAIRAMLAPLKKSAGATEAGPAAAVAASTPALAALTLSQSEQEVAAAAAPAESSVVTATAPDVKAPPPDCPASSAFRSGLVSVETRSGRGRCAIAARPLSAGQLLDDISSPPYAALLLPTHHPHRCEFCLNEPQSGGAASMLSCGLTRGCAARYCSAACRDAGREEHRRSCAALADRRSPLFAFTDHAARSGPTDRRSMLLLAARCLWRRHSRRDPEADRLFDELSSSNGSPDAPSPSMDELWSLAERLPGFLPPGTTAASVAALVSKLKCNSFMFADESGCVIGVGCYPRAAVTNHSCAPNCNVSYGRGGMLSIRAACDVAAGSELCHSYTDLVAPTRVRRRRLEGQYGFVCRCERCGPSGEATDRLLDGVLREDGVVCQLPAAGSQVGKALETSESLLQRAARSEDPSEAMRWMQQVAAVRRRLCHPASLLRYHAERSLCALAISCADDATARECGRHVLHALETILAHVPWHPSLSVERMQQACSEAILGDRKEAVRLMDLVVQMLTATHGAVHAVTQRALLVADVLRKTPQVAKAGKLMRPYTTAVSRVRRAE